MKRLRQAWMHFYDLESKTADISKIESSIEYIYKRQKLPKPLIFKCQSPWQVSAMPVALQLNSAPKRVQQGFYAQIESTSSAEAKNLQKQIKSEFNRLNLDSKNCPELNLKWEKKTPVIVADINSTDVFLRNKIEKTIDEKLLANLYLEYESSTGIEPNREIQDLLDQLEDEGTKIRLLKRLKTTTKTGVYRFARELNNFHAWRMVPHLEVQVKNSKFGSESALLLKIDNSFNHAGNIWWGTWSSNYLPLYSVISKEFGLFHKKYNSDSELEDCIMTLCSNCFCISFYDNACFISESPEALKLNDQGSIHSSDGPAVAYKDGFKGYSLFGIEVPQEVIENPEILNADYINETTNQEVKRVLLRHYGEVKFLNELDAQPFQNDHCGELFRIDVIDDEPLVMVKVINSTREPDGTFNTYFLRVPPSVTTAREAVAWTFGLRESEYDPAVET